MRHSRLLVWRKPRNERWNNICVFVLHKLGLYCVAAWISSCERLWIRLLLNLRQRMGIGAVVSTCDCCGKRGHAQSKCQKRDAMCTILWKVGHLKKMCRQREKIDGKTNSSSNFHTRSLTSVTVSTDVFPHFFGNGFVPRCAWLPTVESPLCFVYQKKSGKVHDEFPPTQTNKVGHESRYWMKHGAHGDGKDGGYGTASLCPNDCKVVKTRVFIGCTTVTVRNDIVQKEF